MFKMQSKKKILETQFKSKVDLKCYFKQITISGRKFDLNV